MAGIGTGARGLTFSMTVPGAAPLAVALSRFAAEVSDFTPFWEGPFKARWTAMMLDQFRSAGASTGAAWAPLSPAYAAWKAKHYGGQGILVRSGSMSSGLIYPSNRGGLGVWRPTRAGLEVGTTARQALVHQLSQRSTLPRRPPLRITPEFMTGVAKDLQKFVVAAWQARRQQTGTA